MAKQVRIRRGTADQHTSFVGALGEVTMDTTNKTLCVHDGVTPGGVALAKHSEIPSPVISDIQKQQNGYVKFANGLIIQWGVVAPTGSQTAVTYPTSFTQAPIIVEGSNAMGTNYGCTSVGSSGFILNASSTTSGKTFRWLAIGY